MEPGCFAFLIFEEPDGTLRCELEGADGRFPLDSSRVSVGSHEKNSLVVDSLGVSPHHARFDFHENGVYLVDLASEAGTFLNGRKITRALLRNGDLIGLGRPVGQRRMLAPMTVELSKKTLPLAEAERPELLEGAAQPLRLGQRSKLEVLLAVSTALSRPERLEARLNEILHIMLEIVEFDRAALSILDPILPAGARFQGEPVFGRQAWRSRYGVDSSQERPELSSTIIRKVLTEGQGLEVKDALLDSEFGAARSVRSQEIRTCVCFPLRTSQSLLGVLYADAHRPRERVDAEEMAFVSAFASHAAVAVENALLYGRIQEETVMRSRLERFLAPWAVEEVIRRPEAARLGGRELEVTILFCDIRNYTELSQRLAPAEVAELLNLYFPEMVSIVFAEGGALEKYIGDALMAVWGSPLELPPDRQARRALEAALAMQKKVVELNRRWPEDRRIEVGIGINTGVAYVGNLGNQDYLQYAAVGAATNLAARLCAQAGPGEVVLSERCRSLLSDSARWRSLPVQNVHVKGYQEPVSLFRVGAGREE